MDQNYTEFILQITRYLTSHLRILFCMSIGMGICVKFYDQHVILFVFFPNKLFSVVKLKETLTSQQDRLISSKIVVTPVGAWKVLNIHHIQSVNVGHHSKSHLLV